jgi:hypothetical protein
LKDRIIWALENQTILFKSEQQEKSHGRIEVRKYEFYDVLETEKAESKSGRQSK